MAGKRDIAFNMGLPVDKSGHQVGHVSEKGLVGYEKFHEMDEIGVVSPYGKGYEPSIEEIVERESDSKDVNYAKKLALAVEGFGGELVSIETAQVFVINGDGSCVTIDPTAMEPGMAVEIHCSQIENLTTNEYHNDVIYGRVDDIVLGDNQGVTFAMNGQFFTTDEGVKREYCEKMGIEVENSWEIPIIE